MQHERVWQPGRPATSENVGDVLASIRRLIAQDQARLPCGRPAVEPAASFPGPALSQAEQMRPPFVLGRQDMIAPAADLRAAQRAAGMATGAPRLHVARPAETAIQAGAGSWQPASIPDWPGKPQPDATTLRQDDWAMPRMAPETDSRDPSSLTDDEEAEFAEAEAALAKMIAPRHTEVTPETQQAAAFEDMPAVEESTMAQDMRMMEMGRIDELSAIRPIPSADGGYDAPRGAAPGMPNLFGEIGGMAKDATLRVLIRDAIQQELHGELGARLSRNMCQMIRQEVEAVIREICAES